MDKILPKCLVREPFEISIIAIMCDSPEWQLVKNRQTWKHVNLQHSNSKNKWNWLAKGTLWLFRLPCCLWDFPVISHEAPCFLLTPPMLRCTGQGRDLILQPASSSTGTPGGRGRDTDRFFDGSGLSFHQGISCHKQHAVRVLHFSYAAYAYIAISTSVASLSLRWVRKDVKIVVKWRSCVDKSNMF